jgi:membrane protein DedA with SNARE-associated domain
MLQDLLGHFTYAAIFALLVLGGIGVPVPEELVQLTAGYMARRGILSFVPAVIVAWAGILAGDYLLFRLGRSHGPRILESRHVARVLTPKRRAFIERHFARHSILTIVAARHASGLRLPVFAMAGASGVGTATFLLADGLSALASVPLVVGLGWYFAGHIEDLKREMRWVEIGLALVVAAGVTIWVLLVRRKERRGATPTVRRAGGEPPR